MGGIAFEVGRNNLGRLMDAIEPETVADIERYVARARRPSGPRRSRTLAGASGRGRKDADVPGWQSARATVVAESGVMAEAITTAVREAGYSASAKTRKPADGPAPPRPSFALACPAVEFLAQWQEVRP